MNEPILKITATLRNQLRIAFDGLTDRELVMISKLMVFEVAMHLANQHQERELIGDVIHDALCTPGRHRFVRAWEKEVYPWLVEALTAVRVKLEGDPPQMALIIKRERRPGK